MNERSLLVIAILVAVIIPAAGADNSRTVKDEINDSELLANMQGRWPKSLRACERALDIAAEPKEFFPLRTRFWQSAQVYHQILEEYPYSGVIPKALFMLGNCYCHLAEKSDPFWRPRIRENVKRSVFYFEKVAERHPYHELAPAARKAADTLKKNWPMRSCNGTVSPLI